MENVTWFFEQVKALPLGGGAQGNAPRLPMESRASSQLASILSVHDGFYSFSGALLFRPMRSRAPIHSIEAWSNPSLWVHEYDLDLGGVVFFAEDVFGVQFCLWRDRVGAFDPESGEIEEVASDLFDFGNKLASDGSYLSGGPILVEWEKKYGKLLPGERLLARVPFVLGGEFEIDNMARIGDVRGMINRAGIANQIMGVPDGDSITLRKGTPGE